MVSLNSKSPQSATPAKTSKKIGDGGEDDALAFLQGKGLCLVTRNYRTLGRGGGEIDVVMRDGEGKLVFVEVRKRASDRHGGAGASVGFAKQRSIIFAARHYLTGLDAVPPCRFDVVALEADGIQRFPAAFDAS